MPPQRLSRISFVNEVPMHAKETPLQELERAERMACNRYLRLLQAFMGADVIEHARRLCDEAKAALKGFMARMRR